MSKSTQQRDTRRLTVAQLEQRLACTKQTIWRWYTQGDFVKRRRTVRAKRARAEWLAVSLGMSALHSKPGRRQAGSDG